MIRKLKIFGLAAVAILAMGVMFSSAAQASLYWFRTDAETGKVTILKGTQEKRLAGGEERPDELTTTAGVVKCTNINYTGGVVGPTATSLTLHPEFSGCTAFGFPAEITTTGCNYVLKVGEVAIKTHYSAISIECAENSEITVIAKVAGITKCTVHIPAQEMGTVFLQNDSVNGVQDIHLETNLSTAFSYKETKGEGAGACVTSTLQGAAPYVGTATFKGVNESGKDTSIFLE